MADLVVGKYPLATTPSGIALRDHAWWYGYRGGIASYAVAAIDMALWDIKGQILGAYRSSHLLAARPTNACPPWPRATRTYERHRAHGRGGTGAGCPRGLQGVKVGFGKRGNARLGFEHDRDVELHAPMRRPGPQDELLMIDCGWAIKWDVMHRGAARAGL